MLDFKDWKKKQELEGRVRLSIANYRKQVIYVEHVINCILEGIVPFDVIMQAKLRLEVDEALDLLDEVHKYKGMLKEFVDNLEV